MHIFDQPFNKRTNFVLCTSPRCGSTWFLNKILGANPDMINHHENLRTLGHGFESTPRSDAERKAQFKGVMRSWENPSVSNCVKVFPLMLTENFSPWRKPTFFEDLLSNTDELYFLFRNDFVAQVESAIIAFYKVSVGEMNFHGSWEEPFHIPDNDIFKQITSTCERQMYAQNMQLLQLWYNTSHEKELVFLEDISQEGKYHRPVTWERRPKIQGIDWDSLI